MHSVHVLCPVSPFLMKDRNYSLGVSRCFVTVIENIASQWSYDLWKQRGPNGLHKTTPNVHIPLQKVEEDTCANWHFPCNRIVCLFTYCRSLCSAIGALYFPENLHVSTIGGGIKASVTACQHLIRSFVHLAKGKQSVWRATQSNNKNGIEAFYIFFGGAQVREWKTDFNCFVGKKGGKNWHKKRDRGVGEIIRPISDVMLSKMVTHQFSCQFWKLFKRGTLADFDTFPLYIVNIDCTRWHFVCVCDWI